MTNGLMARGRTRRQRHHCSSLLAALMVGLALLSTPTVAHALSCLMEGDITAVALCQGEACTAGFKIADEVIPNTLCEPRLAVRTLTPRERANFRQVIEHLEQRTPGVYQLLGDRNCLWAAWREGRCLSTVKVTRLADASAQALARHRAEWVARAQRTAMLRSWSRAFTLALPVLCVLAWPWLVVMLKPSLKKGLLYLAVAALPLQILFAFPAQIMALIFGVEFESLPPMPDGPIEGPHLGWYLRTLVIVVVPLQFGYILWQKFKPAIQ